MSYNIIIPARKGSKGLPLKNRTLVPLTLSQVKDNQNLILTTNDLHIIDSVNRNSNVKNVKIRKRPECISDDEATMKETIQDVVSHFNLKGDLVILYPTYPERTMQDIEKSYAFFKENNLKSMLCRKKVKTHPFMCLASDRGIHGKKIFEHELYRRQDYPDCFEISHFIVILNCEELDKLNNQMFNNETGFYQIDEKIDVDYAKDFKMFTKER